MIDQIQITNFQKHKNLKLELDHGINVITGSSDSGKSSILRALNWAIYNKPSGNSIINNEIKDKKGTIKQNEKTEVQIYKNGKILTRIKTKDQNSYIINGYQFDAIRQDQLLEVQEFFNFSDVNVQRQFDGPFLLNETPGSIAKFFNNLVNLDEIDLFLSKMEQKKRDNKKQIEALSVEIKNIQEEITKNQWIDIALKLINEIQICEIANEGFTAKINRINIDLRLYETHIISLKKLDLFLTQSMEKFAILDDLLKQEISLSTNLMNLNMQNKTFFTHTEKNYSWVCLIEDKFETIDTLNTRINTIYDKQNKLRDYRGKFIDYSATYNSMSVKIDNLKKNIPTGNCPTCGQEVKKEVFNELFTNQ